MTWLRALLIVAGLLMGAAVSQAAESLLIRNVRVIDGNGAPPGSPVDLRIRDGRFAEIGTGLPRRGEPVLDAAGAFALPGLIDAHTHLASVPGGVYRGDSEARRACLLRHHRLAYVAAGVTTILDNAATHEFARWLDDHAEDGLGPRAFYLTPLLTPPNGYFAGAEARGETYAGLWAPVATRADVVAHLDAVQDLRPVGVKVALEDGFGPLPVHDLHTAAMRETIRQEARERGLPLFVHSMSNETHRMALAMQPRALVHSEFLHEDPEPDVIQSMRGSGAYVVSTLAPFVFPQLQWHPDELDTPLMRLLVPELELATARKQDAWTEQNETVAALNTPRWVPRFLMRLGLRWFYGRKVLEAEVEAAQQTVKRLFDAGVPIVMGSDAGNWPVFLSGFHGVFSIREMELLADAGIPAAEVIRAATQRAAELLDRRDVLGVIAVGAHADLILVRANPLEDLRALRSPEQVVLSGVARSPRDWMALAPRCE